LKKVTNKIVRDTEFCRTRCGDLEDQCKLAPEYCIVGQVSPAAAIPIADKVRSEWSAFADEDSILIDRELEGGGIIDRIGEWLFGHESSVTFWLFAVIAALAVIWFIHQKIGGP
jgi:hypothetical protein